MGCFARLKRAFLTDTRI